MIPVNRPVVRATSEIDHRTCQPLVICLVPGGKLVRIKPRRARRWFTCTIKQLWMLAAGNYAAQLKAEKLARRRARVKGGRA